MGIEIERKFLPGSNVWQGEKATVHHIRQGYLARSGGNTVRVRISQTRKTAKAMLCIKGEKTSEGVPEFEFPINVAEAEKLLLMCSGKIIEKKRHHIKFEGFVFEVDEFLGSLRGHVLIEVELESMDQVVILPKWVGKEVTDDKRYTNARFSSKGWPESAEA